MNVAMLAALLAAGAQPQGRIAVLQIQGTRVTPDEAVHITDLLHQKAAVAAKDAGMKVIGSSELAGALETAGIDAAHCEDECVADAGKAASADFVLSGRATKLSGRTSMLLMMHTGDGVLVSSTQVRPDKPEALGDAVAAACKELIAAAAKRKPPLPPKDPAQVAAKAPPVTTPAPAPAPAVKAAAAPARAPAAAVEASADSSPSRTPYVAVGALALGAGLAMDVFPESARDHKLTGADFVPVALYAVGVAVIAWGLTR